MSTRVVAARRSALALAWLALGLLVGACHRKPLPSIGEEAAERAPARPASVAGQPRFVGRWALNQSGCEGRAWVLTTGGMQSPSVLSCSFDKVNPTDAGYTVYSTCTVGKARAPGRLVFTLTRQGATRSLTMNGGPFTEPMALLRCSGPEPAAMQTASGGEAPGG